MGEFQRSRRSPRRHSVRARRGREGSLGSGNEKARQKPSGLGRRRFRPLPVQSVPPDHLNLRLDSNLGRAHHHSQNLSKYYIPALLEMSLFNGGEVTPPVSQRHLLCEICRGVMSWKDDVVKEYRKPQGGKTRRTSSQAGPGRNPAKNSATRPSRTGTACRPDVHDGCRIALGRRGGFTA